MDCWSTLFFFPVFYSQAHFTPILFTWKVFMMKRRDKHFSNSMWILFFPFQASLNSIWKVKVYRRELIGKEGNRCVYIRCLLQKESLYCKMLTLYLTTREYQERVVLLVSYIPTPHTIHSQTTLLYSKLTWNLPKFSWSGKKGEASWFFFGFSFYP